MKNKNFLFIFNNWQKAICVELYNLTLFQAYRSWAKKSLSRYLTNNNNYEMFLTLSVFLFTFSQMIWLRYQEKSFSLFLKNTFPGVCLPSQSLSWDTFSTIFINKNSQSKNLELEEAEIYPNSLFLVSKSNKYFNQKLLDIGVLPIQKKSNFLEKHNLVLSHSDKDFNKLHHSAIFQKRKRNFLSDKLYKSQINSANMTFFSYRFYSKIPFFRDDFPSKLDSNFFTSTSPNLFFREIIDLLESQQTENEILELTSPKSFTGSETNLDVYYDEVNKFDIQKEKTISFKKAIPPKKIWSDDSKINNLKRFLNPHYKSLNLNSVKSSLNTKVFPLEKQSIHSIVSNNETSLKLSKLYQIELRSNKENEIVKHQKNIIRECYWKATLSKKQGKSEKIYTLRNENDGLISSEPSLLESTHTKFAEKKKFFATQITHFFHQTELNPFFSLENVYHIENEKDRHLKIQESLSQIFFPNIGSYDIYDILDSISPSNGQKSLFLLNSKLRSGFFYPDEFNITTLINQLTYQKNPILHFYKKTFNNNETNETINFRHFTSSETKLADLPLPSQVKKIVQLQVLPIEVIFHPNISRLQFEKTLDFFNYSQDNKLANSEIHGFQGSNKKQKKNQFFDFQYRPLSLVVKNQTFYSGDGLLKKKVILDTNLSNKKEITKWEKKYYSSKNVLKDRKDNFFGYLPHFLPERYWPNFFEEKGLSSIKGARLTNVKSKKKEKIIEFLIPASYFNSTKSQAATQHFQESFQKQKELKFWAPAYFAEFFTNLPVILCTENWQIPYIKKEEWEYILQQLSSNSFHLKQINQTSTGFISNSPKVDSDQVNNLFENLSKLDEEFRSQVDEEIELSLPLIRIALPTTVSENQELGLENKITLKQPWPLAFIDYKPNDLHGFFGKILNPTQFKYKSLPWSQSQWSSNLVSKISFGEVYKRETTIFFNKQKKNLLSNWALSNNLYFVLTTCFNTHWEPLTLNSWMFLNQFCFIFFCFKVCQWCYQEYGKEVLLFVIEALESLGAEGFVEGLKEEFQLQKSGTGFRILKSIKKRFKDVAGIDRILPDLSEIVWFLRNSSRSFKIGKIIPKGILFVGSPGTGKTFLASAIAGEAEVPVLVQSGSTLSVPNEPGKGAERLKNLFQQARELAPCIIFIDEIDTLGEKRQYVTRNPLGEDEIFEALSYSTSVNKQSNANFLSNFQTRAKTKLTESIRPTQKSSEFEDRSLLSEHSKAPLLEKKGDQLNILTQFLVEMDGLESRQGIIVIGATNRPGVLDPAFTRPGRFDQIIQLEIPTKQKRIEIFKLYSKNLGINSNLSWNYLANRTSGCSAADLSAAMNESSIQAILKDTTHTVETIEQGLDFIQNSTRQKLYFRKRLVSQQALASVSLSGKAQANPSFLFENGKINLKQKKINPTKLDFGLKFENCVQQPEVEATTLNRTNDPFFLKRLAYSQAGKVVLFTLLPQHQFPIFLNLWTLLYSDNLRKYNYPLKPFSTRFELENKLVGFYAGKACELLALFKNSSSIDTNFGETKKLFSPGVETTPDGTNTKNQKAQNSPFPNSIFTLWESDLNREDMLQASLLAQSMVNRWFFYSKKLSFQKWNGISTTHNEEIFAQNQDGRDISFLKNLALQIEIEPQFKHSDKNWQKFSFRAWWQNNVVQQTGSSRSKYFFSADWYRIYLPDPEESLRNEEFLPSDEYYHNDNRSLNLLQSSKQLSLYWNDLYKNNNDFLYQAVILSSFNKAFFLLDQNREIIDFFADFLLRYETIREKEISHLLLKFQIKN